MKVWNKKECNLILKTAGTEDKTEIPNYECCFKTAVLF